MPGDKRQRLLELARKRKRRCWDDYRPLGYYHDGAYECDWVSPYSKTAGNVNARVFVLLQDWSSDNMLSRPLNREVALRGHKPNLPTNRNLRRLLRQTFNLTLEDVYGTNLFPFIKLGGLSTRIPVKDLVRAAREFALPQIRIVQPALVICLGLATFNAIRRACGLTPSINIQAAIDSPFTVGTARIWCQAHTGAFGQNNRGGPSSVSSDWLRMKHDMERGDKA
jgi:hypothetical protein